MRGRKGPAKIQSGSQEVEKGLYFGRLHAAAVAELSGGDWKKQAPLIRN
jgi:hypothetical protein